MNCCDDNGDCTQGRDCPVRKGYTHRRVRGNSTPPPDMPIQFARGHEDEDCNALLDDPGPAWWEIAIAMVIMVIVIAILVVSSWRIG
jgi:hypothetical protein